MNAFSILPLVLTLLGSLNPGSRSFVGKCVTVLDGDTIDISRDGNVVRIRLEGIDAPERNQPYAEEAKRLTAGLVAGKTVTIIEKEKDTYGRTVARVFVDGRDVSVELLKAGLATHFKKYNSDWLLAALEEEARTNEIGMWASQTTHPLAEKPPSTSISGAGSTAGSTAQVVYHGNLSSHVFHSPSCRNYDCKNCTRVFKSREAAIAAGFRACGMCRP